MMNAAAQDIHMHAIEACGTVIPFISSILSNVSFSLWLLMFQPCAKLNIPLSQWI